MYIIYTLQPPYLYKYYDESCSNIQVSQKPDVAAMCICMYENIYIHAYTCSLTMRGSLIVRLLSRHPLAASSPTPRHIHPPHLQIYIY